VQLDRVLFPLVHFTLKSALRFSACAPLALAATKESSCSLPKMGLLDNASPTMTKVMVGMVILVFSAVFVAM
jgi:hypothetical protein